MPCLYQKIQNMKTNKNYHLIIGALMIYVMCLSLPSCAVFNGKKIESQKRGFMIQDKSQFSKNKGHFKNSGNHKKRR
jgi:hypothetical protein